MHQNLRSWPCSFLRFLRHSVDSCVENNKNSVRIVNTNSKAANVRKIELIEEFAILSIVIQSLIKIYKGKSKEKNTNNLYEWTKDVVNIYNGWT